VPRRTVEDGVREIAAALRDGLIDDYRHNRYSNYKTLSDPSNHLTIRSQHISELYAPSAVPEIEIDVATAESGS
jgi:hypothetical protein